MGPMRVRCVLVVAADGAARRVGPNGVMIGRDRDCDLVLRDAAASRRHALVRATATGAEVVPLGRAPVDVNGAPHRGPVALANGDRIGVPGLELRVELAAAPPEPDAAGVALERTNGARFGVAHTPFVLGGGDDDDVIVKRWPARALVVHVARGELFVEAGDDTDAVTVNGRALEPGAVEPLAIGDTLAYRGEVLRVVRVADRATTTAVGGALDHPQAIGIEMLPRGGRIAFRFADAEHVVYLPDRRFDLMVALLRPPAGYRAGDVIPDDVVRTVVWPRKPGVSRNEINMLISRCRRDLVEAGLAGPRLLERGPGGGGTRIVVGERTEIAVKS